MLGLQLLILLSLIVLNGLFAMTEIAIVSSSRSRLQGLIEAGHRGAAAALALKDDPNTFLSTVQVGITLVGVLSGAFGGAVFAGPLSSLLSRLPFLGDSATTYAIAFALVVVLITYVSLVVGELAPKRLALGRPEAVAAFAARPMRLLARFSHPLVQLLAASTEGLLRVLRFRAPEDPAVSDADLQALLQEGTDLGVFEESERLLVENTMALADRHVADVMTPRREVASLPVDTGPAELLDLLSSTPYSRLVVTGADAEEFLGLVHARDLLQAVLSGQPLDLAALTRPAGFVPESASLLNLLETFRETGASASLVVDEYGGVAGLVTFQDLADDLLGPSLEASAQEVVQEAEDRWTLDGSVAAAKLCEVLGLEELPYQARAGYRTVGGLVTTALGRLAEVGDVVEVGTWRLTVTALGDRRVAKVVAERQLAP